MCRPCGNTFDADRRLRCRYLVAPNDVQLWLGHSSFSTTANIYAHIDVDSKMEAANMIASKINLGELPEKRNLPSKKSLRRKTPLGKLVRQNQRKINPFCLPFGVKVADKMADKPKSCLPHKKIPKPLKGLGIRNAGDGGRTHTVSPPTDFESVSSANSNTPA